MSEESVSVNDQLSASLTLGLRVTDVQQARDFYKGIGFEEVMIVPNEKGMPLFCAMRYGANSLVFDGVETEMPMPDTQREREMKKGPRGLGVKIGLEVPDIDPIYAHFKKAGCEITCEPMEEFWCERLFTALDPFGYEWQFTQGAKSGTIEEQVEAAKQEWGL